MRYVSRLVIVLSLSSFLLAQQSHRRPLPDTSPENVPQPVRHLDQAKLKQEAEELSELVQTIPVGVERARKGLLPKDLDDKLKRIEKLSKQLRRDLAMEQKS